MENNEQKKEQPAADAGNGNKSATDEIFNRADNLRERLEEQNKRAEELFKQNQELMARQILGGRSEAGQQPIPIKEENSKDYAKRLINGDFRI